MFCCPCQPKAQAPHRLVAQQSNQFPQDSKSLLYQTLIQNCKREIKAKVEDVEYFEAQLRYIQEEREMQQEREAMKLDVGRPPWHALLDVNVDSYILPSPESDFISSARSDLRKRVEPAVGYQSSQLRDYSARSFHSPWAFSKDVPSPHGSSSPHQQEHINPSTPARSPKTLSHQLRPSTQQISPDRTKSPPVHEDYRPTRVVWPSSRFRNFTSDYPHPIRRELGAPCNPRNGNESENEFREKKSR